MATHEQNTAIHGCTLFMTDEAFTDGTHPFGAIRVAAGGDGLASHKNRDKADGTENLIESPTCRAISIVGQLPVEIQGHDQELDNEIAALHIGFWCAR